MRILSIIVNSILAILTISVIISIFFPNLFPVSQEQAAEFVKSFTYDRLVFVLIQIGQVIIPPISHYFTSILGGFIYGPIEGGLLNWVGRVIGQFIAFFIAYRFAAWVAEKKLFSLGLLERLVAPKGGGLFLRMLIILLMIALPFFPDDELSYAMGFARMPIWAFSIVTVIGHLLGSFALAFLGSGLPFEGPLFISLAVITAVCLLGLVGAAWKFRKANADD